MDSNSSTSPELLDRKRSSIRRKRWKRRRYPEAFKKETVEYLISSGKPILHVARELGVHDVTLGKWKRQYAGDPSL